MALLKEQKRLKNRILFLFLSIMALTPAWSQDLSRQNWYYGNSTNAIRFNRSTNLPSLVTNKAIPFGTGGSAVATDPANANLLFYTDGNRVYDAYHQLMPGTTGLNANTSANQPVVITPIPGIANANKYFIFTNTTDFTTAGSISRFVIDMNQFGNAAFPAPARGAGEGTIAAVTGLSNRSEGMIVVPHANGTDFWLITHQNNSQIYAATLITAASYTGTFTTTVTSGIGLPTSVAHFAYHPTLKKIAIAPQDTKTDAIILNFNDATGVFSFDRTIFNSGTATTTNQSIYDIEWSPSGRFLYLSRFGETGITPNVFQYDYLNPGTTLTSILPLTTLFRSYGLQLAPDRTIYHLYQTVSGGPFLTGQISRPDSLAVGARYVTNPFGTSDFIGTQFPSFSPSDTANLTVNFTSIGTCQNTPTTFFPEVQPGADSLNWNFGDGSGTNAWSPVHTYENAQTFNVRLTAFYGNAVDSVTLPVTIQSFALQIQLTQDTTACRSEFPPPRGSSSPKQFSVKAKVSGGTPTSYAWSNGDIGDTLTPDSAGYYYVVVTDASGCSAYAGVNVKEYGLQDQTYNKWYFGNKAGMDFNFSPPKALSESAMNAPAGCAIVCDKNGQQILYTDGDKVYNRNHQVISSATGIGGDPSSSQSAIIIPVPGDETLYYIFTTEAINGTSQNQVYYSLFDLKKNSGLGAMVKEKVPLFAKSTERLTASAQWLIAHEYGNNTFRAYSISAEGIGDPVYSSIGSDHEFTSAQNGQGYMKLGPRNNLAVALSTPGVSNLIELFQLNDSTGTIGNYRKIDLKEPTGQVYGVEFSPGGNKVFATVKGTPSPSKLFEYSIDSLEKPHFKQQIQGTGEFGALALGPNGQIYMAINNSGVLGTIAANDDTTRLSSFTPSGFTLASGTNSNLGLPNFIQVNSNALGGPSITVTGICVGDSTTISGSSRDQIDEFNWQVRQGANVLATSQEASFKFLFPAAGLYRVSLRLHNRCAADTTLTRDVTIFNPPIAPGAAVPLCTGSAVLDANPANAPDLNYLWSTDETTQTITVNQQDFYTVDVTNSVTGCVAHGNFVAVDNRPKVELGPDLTLCQNTNTPALNAQNQGANYQWTINGVNSNTTQFQPVSTTTGGVFTYGVRVTDPVTTCFADDTKTFTINTSPAFTLTGTNPSTCGGNNGTVTLQINPTAPATGPYSYFLTGPGGFNQQGFDQEAPVTVPFTGRIAGTYSVVVSDQISGCSLSTSVGLIDAAFVYNATQTACDPSTVVVNFASGTPGTPPFQYTFTNSGTGTVIGPQASNTASLARGNYTIEVKDKNGAAGACTFTFPISINPTLPTVTINTTSLCSNSTLNATVSSGTPTAYAWTGPGIVGSATGASVTINASGTYSVAVTINSCPITQQIDVIYDNATSPSFTQSDACQETVILTASPSGGSYNYRWFKNGVYQSSLGGSSVSLGLTENGASYRVDIVNTVNGCIYQSPDKIVQVTGPVSAALITTPPCEDGQPFTLTATTNATGVTYVWSRNGTVLPDVTTATTQQTINGRYTVAITKGTCSTTAELSIIKQPIPIGLLPDRVIICNDPDNKDESTNHYDLDPGIFAEYEWLKNDLSLNYTQQVYTATSEGLYVVNLTNAFGCVASDQTDVLNQCIPKIVAPNAFRPSSQVAENKDFHVISFFITEDFEVFIYNRWGELVYQSNDRHFKWNGGYNGNGNILPGGTYAYVIRYVSAFRPDLGKQEQRGGVALLK